MRRPVRRALAWSAASALAATVLVAALHMPFFMRRVAGDGAGCPFGAGADASTPAQRDANRRAATQRLRGDGVAATRPAGDFALGVSSRGDVLAWAGSRGTSCGPGRDKRGLRCEVEARSGRSVVYADFDRSDVLVGLLSMTYSRDAAAASAGLADARATLQGAVGAPTRAVGDDTAAYLAGGPLRQARAEFRRANYFASVSATNLGASGYVVSHLYRSID